MKPADGHRVMGLVGELVLDETWCADCGRYVPSDVKENHDRTIHPGKAAPAHYGAMLRDLRSGR